MKNVLVLLVALGWGAHATAQTAPAPARAPEQKTAQVSAAGGVSPGASLTSLIVDYAPSTIFYIGFAAVIADAFTIGTTTASHH